MSTLKNKSDCVLYFERGSSKYTRWRNYVRVDLFRNMTFVIQLVYFECGRRCFDSAQTGLLNACLKVGRRSTPTHPPALVSLMMKSRMTALAAAAAFG